MEINKSYQQCVHMMLGHSPEECFRIRHDSAREDGICLDGSFGSNEIVTVFLPHPNTSSKVPSSDVTAPLPVVELFINPDRAPGTVCCSPGW